MSPRALWIVLVVVASAGCPRQGTLTGDPLCDDLVTTPGGGVPRICVHEVPNGATVGDKPDGTTVVTLDGKVVATYPPCPCAAKGRGLPVLPPSPQSAPTDDAETDARDGAREESPSLTSGSSDANGVDSPRTDATSVADASVAEVFPAAADGGEVGSGDAASSDAAGLTMLQFGNLGIDSIRWEVWGVDAATGLCVDIVWDFSNTHHAVTRHCDDFGPNFPYVFLSTGACGPHLHYSGNAQILSASGCIEFKTGVPSSVDFVDVTLQVQSALYTGEIRARN
jgi:hypothetical protein